ncbi:HD domain-containing protein [Streptantibioticus cattleyicolor]|nr:HD domain-containing protein [Streptantibioticus cattleyicolor]CCB71387.1 conserved exported protein of unknown function [Streptantibioticus cattleyicolor NRRL 8057 = DSM 46488]
MDNSNEHNDVTRRMVLGRGASIAVAGAVTALTTGAVAAPAARAATPGPRPDALPSSVAGVPIPDSRLAREAVAFARGAAPEVLFNHVMRTYVFGALVFDRRGVRYDRELVFVASVLHDLGLVESFQTPTERFEVDGADAAQRFLLRHRMSADRAALVWDAIALHTSVGIATRKRPEIAMVSVGSGLDFSGNGLQQIPSDVLEEVLTAFPREGFKEDAVDRILSLCRTKPMAELMHPFVEVGRRHIPGFPVPTVEDMLLAAPFDS